MKRSILILPIVLFTSSLFAELDFGDHKSHTITTKAWEALGEDKNDDAITFAKKCIELYEKEAIAMQKGLKAPVDAEDHEAVSKMWALNDVGTCYFIMGKAQDKKEATDKAKAAYQALIKKVSYAQCWDPNGWYWKPAEAARERLDELK